MNKCVKFFMAHGREGRLPIEERGEGITKTWFHWDFECHYRISRRILPIGRQQYQRVLNRFLSTLTDPYVAEDRRLMLVLGKEQGTVLKEGVLLGLDWEQPLGPLEFFLKIIGSCAYQSSYCYLWRIYTKVKGIHFKSEEEIIAGIRDMS